MKAQDMAQDMAQDVAEGASGAAEDGGVNVLILPIAIFQRRNSRQSHGCRLIQTSTCRPHATLGRHVKDEHV